MKYKYNGQWYDVSIKALDSMPIGSIILFAGETIPTGWLICNGDTLNEEEYPELFDVIRYKYGGSGLDFNLPNFKGRVPVGLDSTQTEFDTLGETGGSKELQRHSHQQCRSYQVAGFSTPYQNPTEAWGLPDTTGTGTVINNIEDAGTGDSGNLQPYLVVNYIIKATNTTPTMASIVNAYSTSTQNGYGCDYVNTELDKKLSPTNLYYNASGTTGEVSLSDNRNDYLFIIITWDKDGTVYSTIADKNANYIQLSGVRSNLGYNQICFFGKLFNLSNTKITPNQYSTFGEIAININGGNISSSTTDNIKIIKVVGYK